MKQILLMAVAGVLSLTSLQAQKTFTGTIEYEFKIDGDNVEMMASMFPSKMVVLYGEESMMTYFVGGFMASMMGKIVVNGDSQEVYMRKDEEKAIYVMGPEDMEGNKQNEPKEVTEMKGETETIAGYSCKKYKMIMETDGKESIQYIWTTEKLKAPEMDQQGFEGFGSSMINNSAVPPTASFAAIVALAIKFVFVVFNVLATTVPPCAANVTTVGAVGSCVSMTNGSEVSPISGFPRVSRQLLPLATVTVAAAISSSSPSCVNVAVYVSLGTTVCDQPTGVCAPQLTP